MIIVADGKNLIIATFMKYKGKKEDRNSILIFGVTLYYYRIDIIAKSINDISMCDVSQKSRMLIEQYLHSAIILFSLVNFNFCIKLS